MAAFFVFFGILGCHLLFLCLHKSALDSYVLSISYVPNYCNPCNPSFSVIRSNFGPFHFELLTICCTWMNNKRCLTLFLTIYGVRGKFENFKENFVNTNFFFMSFLSVRTPTSSWLRPRVKYNTRCISTWSYSSVATSPRFIRGL